MKEYSNGNVEESRKSGQPRHTLAFCYENGTGLSRVLKLEDFSGSPLPFLDSATHCFIVLSKQGV